MDRYYHLSRELSSLFDLESDIDRALSESMQNLNKYLASERSSIFLFQPLKDQLSIFSSIDLEKHDIRISKYLGVAGWVFKNRKPAVVNNVSGDRRFCSKVDRITGFRTRKLICAPLIDNRNCCLGTLQALNKKTGDFTTGDLQLLVLTARMVAIAINNSKRYAELKITNAARKNLIKQIMGQVARITD